MILTLIVVPVFKNISAEKDSAFLDGKELLVVDNGFEFKIRAIGNGSEEILRNSGIVVGEKDIVFPAKPKEGQKIIILRAMPLSLNIFGKSEEIFTSKKTVKEVLEEAGFKVSKGVFINYSLGEEVSPGMKIKIWKKKIVNPITEKKPKIEIKKEVKLNTVKQKPKAAPKIQKTGETQTGSASWYSYIPGNYCASLTFPRGTKLLVTNLLNGRSVIVVVNDRGPFNGRVIDLERNAFSKIASLSAGTARVKVERVK
ncbi:MAG: RlpA-like double-psi beta-barrel domain-containing protein [Candidatus Pacebacteria bacterium]|nr:RlpA-like double-psi beta-barrel domain-containing protein [Candidatus Paceibacterota bacterium]